MNTYTTARQGYVALASVLVIAAVAVIIGTTVALLSINSLQASFAHKQAAAARSHVGACAEDALLRLNKNNALPADITLPSGSCPITINMHSGNDWTFTVSGTLNNYTASVQIEATRAGTITINSWSEL